MAGVVALGVGNVACTACLNVQSMYEMLIDFATSCCHVEVKDDMSP